MSYAKNLERVLNREEPLERDLLVRRWVALGDDVVEICIQSVERKPTQDVNDCDRYEQFIGALNPLLFSEKFFFELRPLTHHPTMQFPTDTCVRQTHDDDRQYVL